MAKKAQHFYENFPISYDQHKTTSTSSSKKINCHAQCQENTCIYATNDSVSRHCCYDGICFHDQRWRQHWDQISKYTIVRQVLAFYTHNFLCFSSTCQKETPHANEEHQLNTGWVYNFPLLLTHFNTICLFYKLRSISKHNAKARRDVLQKALLIRLHSIV